MTNTEYLDWFGQECRRTIKEHGVEGLSRLQRDALCTVNFQAEVNNGGIHQYLYNSSGDFAKETPAVFRRMRAEVAAEILEQVNSLFGPEGPPIEREVRIEKLDGFSVEDELRIDKLTSAFYDAEDQGLCLADLLDEHILRQRDESTGEGG